MEKTEILRRLGQMSQTELNEMIKVYRTHKPRVANGRQVIVIPEYVKHRLSGLGSDNELVRIIKTFPTCLTEIEPPSKALAEKAKQIYIDHCFCFDEIGELFVQKVLEYASSYQTRPLILHGMPGCGKSHRASVLAKMMGLPYSRADITLVVHGSGLAGEAGSYKDASLGLLSQGMCTTGSCNYLLNGEELDKDENNESRVSFSNQFLKVLDEGGASFRDNRLGFDIDVSHIVYVFTANEKDKISTPMLDRCDVVELSSPSRLELDSIVRGAVIPKSLDKVCAGREISFPEETIEFILDSLWQGEKTSIRQYQSLISRCVSTANYIAVCEERPVVIGVADAREALRKMSASGAVSNKRKIGIV